MPLACSPWRQTRRRVHQSGRGAQGELVVRQWRGAVRAVTRVQRVEMTKRSSWVFVLMAAAILMVTMGTRQSMGLFLSPLNTQTGLGIANISFAMAIAQLVWGGCPAGVRRGGRPLGSRPCHRSGRFHAGRRLGHDHSSHKPMGADLCHWPVECCGRRCRQLLHPHWRDGEANSCGAALICWRRHQCRRKHGAVCLCSAQPSRDVGLRLDAGHVDDGSIGIDNGADGMVAARIAWDNC